MDGDSRGQNATRINSDGIRYRTHGHENEAARHSKVIPTEEGHAPTGPHRRKAGKRRGTTCAGGASEVASKPQRTSAGAEIEAGGPVAGGAQEDEDAKGCPNF